MRVWEHIATTAPIHEWGRSCAYDRGHLYGTFEDCVQSLNVSTGQWEELPRLSEYRYHATPCVVDGRLFIIGGEMASAVEYVASEQRWVSVLDMPREVWDAAAVALDGKLLVIGGVDPDTGEALSAVLEYNLVDRSWKELPSLLTGRSSCAATVLGVTWWSWAVTVRIVT